MGESTLNGQSVAEVEHCCEAFWSVGMHQVGCLSLADYPANHVECGAARSSEFPAGNCILIAGHGGEVHYG